MDWQSLPPFVSVAASDLRAVLHLKVALAAAAELDDDDEWPAALALLDEADAEAAAAVTDDADAAKEPPKLNGAGCKVGTTLARRCLRSERSSRSTRYTRAVQRLALLSGQTDLFGRPRHRPLSRQHFARFHQLRRRRHLLQPAQHRDRVRAETLRRANDVLSVEIGVLNGTRRGRERTATRLAVEVCLGVLLAVVRAARQRDAGKRATR